MRLLLLTTDLQIGGTPTVVRELALRLPSPSPLKGEASGIGDCPRADWDEGERFHIQVACLSEIGPVAAELRSRHISVTALNARSPRDLHIIPRLHRLIRDHNIDTVFSFLLHANAAAAATAPFNRDVCYLQSIQTTQPNPRWHWKLQRLIHRAAEKIIVPSSSVADAAHRWSCIPHDKILVIPNAVDPQDYALPLTHRSPYDVGFLGRLDLIKRVPDLVDAMSLLPLDVRLHIFGDGPERPNIECHIRRLGLNRRITLHGGVQRPQDAFSRIGLLVLPSDAEGFGLVLIEAMAAGIPVVATNVAGIRDVVTDGKTGLLVPPRKPKALAEAIQRVISDDALRKRLIEQAGNEVRGRFSWHTVTPMYRQLLSAAQRQPASVPSPARAQPAPGAG